MHVEARKKPAPMVSRQAFDRLRVEHLLSGAFDTQLGAVATAIILAITFSHEATAEIALSWTLLVMLVAAARCGIAYRYHTRDAGAVPIGLVETRYAWGSLAAGCMWGAGGLLFFSSHGPEHQILLLMVLGGICTVAVPMQAVSPKSLAALVVPTILPGTLMLLAQNDVHSHSLGIIALIFIAMLAVVARNFYFTFTRGMRLQIANQGLREEAEKRTGALEAAQQQILAEQEVALQLFDYVLPREALNASNINYHLSPHSLFNGDLLLVESRPDGTQHFMLGDFTGHGLVASLGALQVINIFNSMTRKGFYVDDIAAEINRKLNEQLPPNLFCAACLVEIDHVRRNLRVWNGGLPSVYVLHGHDGSVRYKLPSEHAPLGILGEEDFDRHLVAISLDEGDHFVMATDGVIEQIDRDGEPFGEERLEAVLNATRDIHDLTQSIKDALEEHCVGIGQTDDISFVAVQPSAAAVTEPLRTPLVPELEQQPGAGSWRILLELDAATLRHINPVPLVNHVIHELYGQADVGSEFEVVLDELFRNALEHGVLKLDSGLKRSPDGFMRYYEERRRRLDELQDGRIQIELRNVVGGATRRYIELDIIDSGEGFDHEAVMRCAAGRLAADNAEHHGRGIALAQELCEEVSFGQGGRQVRARYLCNTAEVETDALPDAATAR